MKHSKESSLSPFVISAKAGISRQCGEEMPRWESSLHHESPASAGMKCGRRHFFVYFISLLALFLSLFALRASAVKGQAAVNVGIVHKKTVRYAAFDPDNIKKQDRKISEIFKVPSAIQDEVNFWKDIYTKYDKTKVVFHDKKYMNVVYSVIDISDIVNNEKLTDEEKARRKKERVDGELKRISGILEALDKKDYAAMTANEKKIYHLFKNVKGPDKFKAALERIRSQTGIAEKFRNGIKISGRYLGEMEKIFRGNNIPLEITRLVFVESMFDLGAVSKSGASGVWQFMPGTGKLFLTINQIVDERNDPISATEAAAKHLLRDYAYLGTWPLAINAYNSGRGRLEKAVAKMGTKDIAKIIKEYEQGGYSFASRNFYPAFLAALDVFENRGKYFGHIEMEKPLAFDVIETQVPLYITDFIKRTGISIDDIRLLNFHIQKKVLDGLIPLPAGFKLRVPVGQIPMDNVKKLSTGVSPQ